MAVIIDVAVWTALGTLKLTVKYDGRPHRAQHRARVHDLHAYGKTPRHGGPVIIIAYRAGLTLRMRARCVGAHMHTPRAPGRAAGLTICYYCTCTRTVRAPGLQSARKRSSYVLTCPRATSGSKQVSAG